MIPEQRGQLTGFKFAGIEIFAVDLSLLRRQQKPQPPAGKKSAKR